MVYGTRSQLGTRAQPGSKQKTPSVKHTKSTKVPTTTKPPPMKPTKALPARKPIVPTIPAKRRVQFEDTEEQEDDIEEDTELSERPREVDFEATKQYNKKKLQKTCEVTNHLTLTTSDVKSEVEHGWEFRASGGGTNYPLHVFYRLYANSPLVTQKKLAKATRYNFDIVDVEDALSHEIELLVGEEDYHVAKRTAVVKTVTR